MSPINKIDKFSTFVQLMVDGVKHEWVTLDMSTYGERRGDICVGCAATNALCELNQKSFTVDSIHNEFTRSRYIGITTREISVLEMAWNQLRQGRVAQCLRILRGNDPLRPGNGIDLPFKIPTLDEIEHVTPECGLPMLLGNVDDRREIIPYQIFANELRKAGL